MSTSTVHGVDGGLRAIAAPIEVEWAQPLNQFCGGHEEILSKSEFPAHMDCMDQTIFVALSKSPGHSER